MAHLFGRTQPAALSQDRCLQSAGEEADMRTIARVLRLLALLIQMRKE